VGIAAFGLGRDHDGAKRAGTPIDAQGKSILAIQRILSLMATHQRNHVGRVARGNRTPGLPQIPA
jgi:hypothetical protein